MNTEKYFEHIGSFLDMNNYVCVDDYLRTHGLDATSIEEMKAWIESRFTKSGERISKLYFERLLEAVTLLKTDYEVYLREREGQRQLISDNNTKQRELFALYTERRQEYATLSTTIAKQQQALDRMNERMLQRFNLEIQQQEALDDQAILSEELAQKELHDKLELSRRKRSSLNRKINDISKSIRNLKSRLIELDRDLNAFEQDNRALKSHFMQRLKKVFQFMIFRTTTHHKKLYMYNAMMYQLEFIEDESAFNKMLINQNRKQQQYDGRILHEEANEWQLRAYRKESEWILNHLGEFESSHTLRNILDSDDDQNEIFVKLQHITPFYSRLFDESRQYDEYEVDEYHFMYRGHSDSNYSLAPSIYRKQKWLESEEKMYRDLHIKCSEELSQYSRGLEVLASMQHYSLPTRLLDLTSSPLIALFFATEMEPDMDGEFLVFAEEERGIEYYDSDKAEMLATLPLLSYNDKNKIKVHAIKCILTSLNKVIDDFLVNGMSSKRKSVLAVRDTMIEDFNSHASVHKLVHEMSKKGVNYTSNINPMDMLDILVVRPIQNNTRIVRQHGAFIINGLLERNECERKIEEIRYRTSNENDDVRSIEAFLAVYEDILNPRLIDMLEVLLEEAKNGIKVRYILPSDVKADLQEWLDVIEINESTIYPDYERVASYLKRTVLAK
ncbi:MULTISPECIES: FRG domain-containing protein [Kurthia]|uniref:FRG domain-containing protein n=2 Tax=Kurthia TaxID=1649 RepID=A0ABW5XYF7_9BACL|nr:FRG domain-containing protein [Kurthia sp. 3B1D]